MAQLPITDLQAHRLEVVGSALGESGAFIGTAGLWDEACTEPPTALGRVPSLRRRNSERVDRHLGLNGPAKPPPQDLRPTRDLRSAPQSIDQKGSSDYRAFRAR